MYTRRMAVAYETETPHAIRTDLGSYREADYLQLPDEPRLRLPDGAVYRSTVITGLELDLEAFWRAIPD